MSFTALPGSISPTFQELAPLPRKSSLPRLAPMSAGSATPLPSPLGLGLCPEKRVSGGKVLSCKTRKVKQRAATALRMGANSLCRAKGYFGEFFRRMRAKLGTAQAITATAHKIARILYHVLLTKEPYAETVFHHCDEQAQQRAEMRLRKQAAQLGFQLLPIPATGQ